MTRRTIAGTSMLAALAATSGVALALHAHGGTARADDGCSAGSLDGAYAYALQGALYDANGNETADVASAGRIVFDGEGKLSGADWFSKNGTASARSYTGTYTLGSDCTGSLQVALTGSPAVPRHIALADGGKQVMVIQINTGPVVSGSFVKQ